MVELNKKVALQQIIEQAKVALRDYPDCVDLALTEIERIARFARKQMPR